MQISDLLNRYIQRLQCSAKDLAEAAGLSPASVSRYRTGDRLPNGEQLNKMMEGIVALAQSKGIGDINDETVRSAFREFLEDSSFDYESFTRNFNLMLSTLDIVGSELAKSLNFDPSYLSRIRLGQRRPSDRDGFIAGVCRYVCRNRNREITVWYFGWRQTI